MSFWSSNRESGFELEYCRRASVRCRMREVNENGKVVSLYANEKKPKREEKK